MNSGRRVRAPAPPLLGLSILAQAGLAVGLVLVTRERFPALAPTVSTVVLGAIVVFEVVGPLAARFALDRSGESRQHETAPRAADIRRAADGRIVARAGRGAGGP